MIYSVAVFGKSTTDAGIGRRRSRNRTDVWTSIKQLPSENTRAILCGRSRRENRRNSTESVCRCRSCITDEIRCWRSPSHSQRRRLTRTADQRRKTTLAAAAKRARFPDDGLSRLHATVYRDGDRVWVVDENHLTTFVNGEKVIRRHSAKGRDSIKMTPDCACHVASAKAAVVASIP